MRTLASIQRIIALDPIKDADTIEVATVLGWKVVVKKGIHKVGELVVYFEIDSLLPELPVFEFLRASSWNEKFKSYRLKSIRLRGQISQGLIIPINEFLELEGLDLTDLLGISKYEPPVPAEISGDAKSFSWPIAKTNETRIQTIPEILNSIKGKPYYISSKLDGTSSTFILDLDGQFHVCGHNYSYKEKEGNTFWELAKKYNIKEKLEGYYQKTGIHIALQGETCGPGIQKNKLGLLEQDVFFFNAINVDNRKTLSFEELVVLCKEFGLKTVPILEEDVSFPYNFVEEVLAKADGFYKNDGFENALPKQQREGIVIRTKDSTISFKVISNAFLLDKKNDD